MRIYRVIYDVISDIEAAIKGMLAPKYKEEILGRAEVRELFKVPNIGVVAGVHVTNGKIISGRMKVSVMDGDSGNYRKVYEGIFADEKLYECFNVTQEVGMYIPILKNKYRHREGCRAGRCSMEPHWAGFGVGRLTTADNNTTRSEERRVGKECRSRWSPYH